MTDGAKKAAAIAVLMGMLLALVAAGMQAGGSSSSERDEAATTTTVPLNDAGRELLALLEKDRNATFHARYTASSAEQPDAQIEIETWRKPPRVRQDSVITTKSGRVHTIAFVTGEEAVRCARLGESGWSCRSRAAEPTSDLLFGGVREQLGKGPVTVADAVIDGRPVRCFTLVADGRTSELCATAEGVPVRVTSAGNNLRLVGFDATVDDTVFTPPAQPVPE